MRAQARFAFDIERLTTESDDSSRLPADSPLPPRRILAELGLRKAQRQSTKAESPGYMTESNSILPVQNLLLTQDSSASHSQLIHSALKFSSIKIWRAVAPLKKLHERPIHLIELSDQYPLIPIDRSGPSRPHFYPKGLSKKETFLEKTRTRRSARESPTIKSNWIATTALSL